MNRPPTPMTHVGMQRADGTVPAHTHWIGVGGLLDQQSVREERGTVHRRRRWFPSWRARIARMILK